MQIRKQSRVEELHQMVWKWYQLVAKVLVPAHVQDGHAKGPLSAGLGVRLSTKNILKLEVTHWGPGLPTSKVTNILGVSD